MFVIAVRSSVALLPTPIVCWKEKTSSAPPEMLLATVVPRVWLLRMSPEFVTWL